MSCIPCSQDPRTREVIDEVAEVLKTHAHLIPNLEMSEQELYETGIFRGAVERIRGQFAASMSEKRAFARLILNHLEDGKFIRSWRSAGSANRFDYEVVLASGTIAAIELKGCLDGNNTNIFERPPQAREFYIWSVCMNAGASPPANAWSGIHTRLGAEIIDKQKQVDGLVIWDMVCGTIGRPCPKLAADPSRQTAIGPHSLPPPCVYTFPETIPAPRNNPAPRPHRIEDLEFLSALHDAFNGTPDEVYSVWLETRYQGSDIQRATRIERGGTTVQMSKWASIRRA